METAALCRLLPTFEILCEAFPEGDIFCREPQRICQSLQLFRGQAHLEENALYLLRRQDAPCFPVDTVSYLCREEIPGKANHICCPGLEEEEILHRAMTLFSSLREQEIQLDQLVYQNASLRTLCETAARLLGNPVYIHDDWFIALAMSDQVDSSMHPEHILSSTRGFVPQAIVDDFKFDNEYLETFSHHSPQFWQGTYQAPRSLYVNLWEGSVYRGRLLIFEANRPFRKQDTLLAALLGQHATRLLSRQRLDPGSYSMDDLVYQLLQGGEADPQDISQMLRSLMWSTGDQFTVIRVQGQQGTSTFSNHLLHSDLFRSFPRCYILLSEQQQVLILNLTREQYNLATIRHTLAPLCRDYCLYAGISSPVTGVGELRHGYSQAGIALDKAFQLRNEKWIVPFSDCALDHWFSHLSGDLGARHLVSPELSYLIRYDQENGTEYFPTLREYLHQERSIPRTSEKLIIHRTTLLYRLKKITSLVSLNLDDPETRLYLQLSLHILESERK